jgi:hypothetical protein
VNIYVIWYGNWASDSKLVLTDLLQNVGVSRCPPPALRAALPACPPADQYRLRSFPESHSHELSVLLQGTPYYNIQTTYGNAATGGTKLSNSIVLAGQTTDALSQGAALTEAAVWTITAAAINAGKLPKDANGIYLVLTAKDVTLSGGFCTAYCGWHSYAALGGVNIKYSFVGDPSTQCPGSCFAGTGAGPNGILGERRRGKGMGNAARGLGLLLVLRARAGPVA